MLQGNNIESYMRGDKIQICNPGRPNSFYITKEEYATIYPNERVPRRLAITFNFLTKTAWYEKNLADFIIQKFPHIYYYDKKNREDIKEHIDDTPDILPETDPNLRFNELKAKGWVHLSVDEKKEYKALKEACNDKKSDSS